MALFALGGETSEVADELLENRDLAPPGGGDAGHRLDFLGVVQAVGADVLHPAVTIEGDGDDFLLEDFRRVEGDGLGLA